MFILYCDLTVCQHGTGSLLTLHVALVLQISNVAMVSFPRCCLHVFVIFLPADLLHQSCKVLSPWRSTGADCDCTNDKSAAKIIPLADCVSPFFCGCVIVFVVSYPKCCIVFPATAADDAVSMSIEQISALSYLFPISLFVRSSAIHFLAATYVRRPLR